MTAPAAAPAPAPIVAPALRAAPQAATDRSAFAAVLDSLPRVAAKSGSPASDGGARALGAPQQEKAPQAPPDGRPTLGDGAFLSSLAFALPAALGTNQAAETEAEAPSAAPASMTKAGLASAVASSAATGAQAGPGAARLTGERAFHFALSSPAAVASLTAGQVQISAPSFAPAATAGAGENKALASPALPPPAAVRGAVTSASPAMSPVRTAAQDSARGGRKSDAAAPSSLPRATSPAAPSAKAAPSDDAADAGRPDPAATQATAFGAQPSASAVAAPLFGSDDAPARAADVVRASAPVASPAPPTQPVKEIDVDLSPSGLENVSMTMRLAGERLSVVIHAASSQTAGSIEGARDAIADRLAAIGQPLNSIIVRQTGVNADGNTNGNASSSDEGSTGGGRQTGEGASEQSGSNSSRRGADRGRSF